MPIEIGRGGTVITGDSMKFYRMLQLRMGLSLELKGMRMSRGVSCYAIVKREYGLRGNKQKVFEAFSVLCDAESAKQERIDTRPSAEVIPLVPK